MTDGGRKAGDTRFIRRMSWYFAKRPPAMFKGAKDSASRYLEVAVVVGDRIRRLRLDRGMTLIELGRHVKKPSGSHYSPSYLSRIERGWAYAPLYAYERIARVFDVDPWLLFAEDEVRHDPRPDELVLLRFLRRAGIAADEALWRLAAETGPGEPPETG